ncbi:MAG: phosphatidate cytidylyltransferase [Rhodocyclales bacterium GT-UBC]|nr:MAG: phosphatidate cytidylyltransferase [Rhodocyclales bacterium GT-UBC]
MLKTRVITALVLLALLLPSLFFLPQSYWAALVGAFIGVAAWEWGGLLAWSALARRSLGFVVFVLCLAISFFSPDVIGVSGVDGAFQPWVIGTYGISAFFWCGVMPFWLWKKWPLATGHAGVLVGAVVLIPTWLAIVQLRISGPELLLAVFAVVWMADIAAYFSGKAFGKHKLAPSISPGKTWEGAFGAMLGVVLYGMVVRFALAMERPSLAMWAGVLLLVTAISIIGDLYESLLKRQAGIKDSSNVLPGHGGVLDRIDSLTSTLPLVALIWLLAVKYGS